MVNEEDAAKGTGEAFRPKWRRKLLGSPRHMLFLECCYCHEMVLKVEIKEQMSGFAATGSDLIRGD